jgi:outer membrane protein assembly factor BamB
MRTLPKLLATSLALVLVSPSHLRAADWPQWRGPNRDDVGKETGLLKHWPEGGPKLAWLNREAGLGYSSFSVVGGKLFTLGARGSTEFLIALSTKDGSELWATPVADLYKNGFGDGPRSTPTVDGERVYTLSGGGTLLCANVADGKMVWKANLQEFGGGIPGWGYCESPLIEGEKVVCTPGGSKGAIAALDKKTGKLIWQSKDFTDGAQYASIIAANHNGARQLIQLTQQSIVGVNAADGSVLWKTPFRGQTAVIPTPLFKAGQVYVTADYGVGCKSVRIGPGNEVTDLYENKVMKNHHGGVILVGDHVYGYSGNVGWVCQDFKTGSEVWLERSKLGKGAIGYADGMLYLLSEDNGTVVLLEASPKGWNEHGRFKLEPLSTQRSSRGRVWTHPVVSNGHLYLRDQEFLFCFDVKQP